MPARTTANTTDGLERLGDSVSLFARFGPEVEACGGGCGRKVPVAHIGTLTFPGFCTECDEAAEHERDRQEREEHRSVLLERCGIPKRMAEWTFDSYPRDDGGAEALNVARDWLDGYLSGTRQNLLLHGDVGGGKTGLAVGIAHALIENDVGPRFAVWRNLLQQMQESFKSDRQITTEALRRCPVLILDDVGAESPTDWRREQLATLVEARYLDGLPMVVTANYPPALLIERLGHDDPVIGRRIVSRMRDGAIVYEVRSHDRRLR